ncbi:hypothetical protein CKO28_07890 [Rhodovibrio sodomensis]|uniref:DUF4145 domain-containing protein n=2 Tax=Rhodovibrio sodomensis TaxID=1088 RepID=A0ABS1DEW8_9PROT|nr:hypothetical protein [Rhodovibrio sodomensis]
MEQLEYPDLATWEERRRWFEALEAERAQGGAASRLSEQACALMVDLQATFCAGAWATTVILAATIVDSQGRFRRPDPDLQAELAWLRLTRNALVHEDPREPAITIEDQWTNRRAWERDARRAVATAIAALYPGDSSERADAEDTAKDHIDDGAETAEWDPESWNGLGPDDISGSSKR